MAEQRRAAKTNSGNYFEDFERGRTLTHAVPRTLTEGDCALYIALYGDRFPLHSSAEYARSLGYERETVNDLLVFHTVFGKSVNDVSLNAVANLGYADVRFLAPVYPGDTLRAVSEVLGKKENKSGQNGIVWVKTVGTNQHGTVVLEYCRWVMVNKRDPSRPTQADDKPTLPKQVEPAQLPLPKALELSHYETWPSGGRAFFDDYAVGEIIDHVDGMTIEEADHTLATRLYQNTAKVHFDAHAAKSTRFGKRLIYGGHIISVARALSFNGLENALSILAWNGGTHANPTFAGDTIYARSEVLGTAAVPGRSDVGALRLRLVAFKNVNPATESVALKIEKDGAEVYNPNAVLDLDYWVLMPKGAAR
jgi:2-methylfumaryl-CoA hydratase